ncbi:zincin-like metallopeptidase toxin domain-containing protein [uncultured Flavobacterium sp.]|uniref:zincin-like metallopeptidase toxin domain-containing protein n=1 Tax=uncultured Flavobacterium sp. TaxID=165435 RepID=UPI0025FC73F1|nr:zincin-like metallopeptidase toxin domain-containing protein [uncultured Flavobacterium sp.]
MSTNNFPIIWDSEADDGFLGSLFPKNDPFDLPLNNTASEKQNPFAFSPLSKNGEDIKNNFFLGSKNYTYGNFEIIVDSSSNQNPSQKIKIIEQTFVVEAKGGNRKLDDGEKAFKVKLFISKESSQLTNLFNDPKTIPDKNEILFFLEDNSGDWSGATMYIKKGESVNNSSFFDKLFSQNSEFASYINSQYNISKSDLQELLRKDKVESNTVNLISCVFEAISFLVSDSKLIKLIASGIEIAIDGIRNNCTIEEKNWNPAKPEENVKFQPLLFPGITTVLDNIDDSEINSLIKNAVKNLRQNTEAYDESIQNALNFISKVPVQAIFPFAINPISFIPGKASFSEMLLEKYKNLRITIDAALDKLENIDFSDILKESIYAVNAFICGLWNGFIEAICGIFSLVQYLFQGAGEIAELLENFKEKGPQLLEQIDDCILAFQELDFGQIFATLATNIKKWALSDSTTSIVEIAYFSGMFIGFVVELAIEIAVGILFTGGVLSIEAIIAKLGETFKALGNLLIGTLKLPFKVAEKSIASLVKSLKWLYEFLSKGTDEIIKLVDEVFTNMKQVVADLAKKFVDDVPNLSKSDLDWMAQAKPTKGNLGGSILRASQIRKLRGLLKEKGIILVIDGDLKSIKKLFKPLMGFDKVDDLFRFMSSQNPPLVGGFDAITKQFILSKEATEIIVFHELAHLKHMEELGEIVYKSLSKLDKEMYVWKQILQNRKLWTDAEFIDSLNYINRIRVNDYGLEHLIIKL